MERTLTHNVGPEWDGARLDTLLRTGYKMSGSLIKELKRLPDGLLINALHAKTTDTLRSGDTVTITMREEASEHIAPVKLPFGMIYEDEDILIADKPSGMPTHISQGNYDNTLSNAVMYYFTQKGEDCVFRAVNRLDKDTSGLLCIAKNKYIHARLCADFGAKAVSRKYLAIVCGHIGDGVVDAPIGRSGESVIKREVTGEGARAVTHYRTLRTFGGFSLVELRLETGRTHQIRVHMAHLGAPLLGDWLYGEENKELFKRTALHSYYLSLTHPLTGERLEFTSGLPKDMDDFIVSQSPGGTAPESGPCACETGL